MSADVIKDYLVALGFDIDEAGKNKFDTVLKGVTANVLKVSAAVEGAALAIVGVTTQIANGLDKVYWASQRTGASVQGIKSLGYAASQMGGDVQAATSSLEELASFMRSNPGAEGFLNRLGVQTRDASGKMRDTAAIFTGVGQKLNNMPYYRAKQYAQMLGIDENTLMAMRRGLGQFSSEYALTAKRIGFNAETAAKQSNVFMTSMRSLTMTLGQARDKIGSRLAGGLAGSIDNLRKQLLDNWPKIEAIIMKVIKGILWAGDAISRVLWRTGQAVSGVIDWFKKLDPAAKQLIAVFAAIALAWRALNIAFAMTPIGLVITAVTALAAAVLLLYDDFKTWKEGGKSLIDWDKWKPAIDYAMKAFSGLGDSILSVYEKAKELGGAILDAGKKLLDFINIDTSKFSGKWLFDQIIESARNAMKVLGSLVDAMKKIINGDFSGAFNSLKDATVTFTQSPIAQGVTDLAKGAWDKVISYFNDEPEQHAQSAPRGIRNNNPGNIDYRGQAGASLERPGGRFAKFETAYDGLKAMARQLMRYFEGKTTGKPLQTLNDIISTWAPGNENNTGAYIAQLSKQLGVAPNAVLNLKDPQVLSSLMNGIIHHENGRNPYPGELVRMAAGGGGSTTRSIQQETTINIHGVSDPGEAARLTVDRQKGVNSQLTQQLPMVPG